MSIVATICKAETWQEIAAFAEEKEEWFRKYIVLENGVPSHDTFERCFRTIDLKQFQNALLHGRNRYVLKKRRNRFD